MIAIVRLYQDSYGENMGSRTFCLLSKYFGGVLVTDNKKIKALTEFKQLTHAEAISNIKKFTKVIVYNTKPNMFGGVAPKHAAEVVRLIRAIPEVYFYNCDPILDLQNSVPSSHEAAVPGLTAAINKITNFGVKLSRVNTDLTLFLAAQLGDRIKNYDSKKEFIGCYFGNLRQPYRQEQVKELLAPLKSQLIIGHEHEDFPWFNYTANFYEFLSMAYVTPIIGDKKLHYETGIPSLRLYEACCSTAIVLIDSRFSSPLFDDRFFFKDVQEFVEKANKISTDKSLYDSMLKHQREVVKKIIRKFKNKKFNWGKVLSQKNKVLKLRTKEAALNKKNIIDAAKQRLIDKGIMKPKRKKKNGNIVQ